MGRASDNPVNRLRRKHKALLHRYVRGEPLQEIAEELYPKAYWGPLYHVLQIMRTEKFEKALDYITAPLLSSTALALRQLAIADRAERDEDKISAVRGASQAMHSGGKHGIRFRSGRQPTSRVGKVLKVQIPPMEPEALRAKLVELTEKAAKLGYSKEKAN